MTIHAPSYKWFEYAPQPTKFMTIGWYRGHSLTITNESNLSSHRYDDITRILTIDKLETVCKTPPPWVGRITP